MVRRIGFAVTVIPAKPDYRPSLELAPGLQPGGPSWTKGLSSRRVLEASGCSQPTPCCYDRVAARGIDAIMNLPDKAAGPWRPPEAIRLALNLLLVGVICHVSTQVGFALK